MADPKKITYVINYIINGGPSFVLRNIISYLDKNKYNITLITLFPGNDSNIIGDLKAEGINVIECQTLSRMGCMLGKAKEFSDVLERANYDVIHAHGFIPDILSSRLHTDARRVSTIHNNMFEDYVDAYGKAKSLVFICLHLYALKKLDCCVCCSESVHEIMKKYLPKSNYIRNGIGATIAKSTIERKSLSIPDKARVYIYAGNLNTGKNIVWLIREFVENRAENEYLLVLGKGPLEAECKSAADGHVIMLGFQNDPIAYFKISDVYVSASKSEGFSISVLEALDNGLGLLLSDIPSHREVLAMSKDTYIGEVFQDKTFANAICKIRKMPLNKERIIAFKEAELSAKYMTEQYIKTYL